MTMLPTMPSRKPRNAPGEVGAENAEGTHHHHALQAGEEAGP